jgi:uncharacterized membrane protein
MTVLAAIRPDDWNLPLFIHVLGAFTLVGALVVAASYLFAARRDGSVALTRVGYRSLLIVALPAFITTRLTAQWIASKEGLEDSDATWITIGYVSTDPGLLILIAATVSAGLAVRRAARAEAGAAGGRAVAVAAWLVMLLVALYCVVIWVMATKPT